MTTAVWILSSLVLLWLIAIQFILIGFLSYSLLQYGKKLKQINEIFKAFEKAFECELLGLNPHINVCDYPMHDQVWMVPCKLQNKELGNAIRRTQSDNLNKAQNTPRVARRFKDNG